MGIENIAIVRATNIIPFDGVVRTISNSQYIKKEIGFKFSNKMSDLLKKKNIIPPVDFLRMSTDTEYLGQKAVEDRKILEEYLPYTSDYNSTILFSLNGLVPDDDEHGFGNNKFSTKKCAIIDGLIYHINEVVSLPVTDTAIKGNVILSKEAIILIEEETYKSLSQQEKEQLAKLNLTIKTFKGDLKDTVEKELSNTGKYLPEKLTLTRSTGGFIQSDTSQINLNLINEIANEYSLPQVLYFDILTGKNNDLDRLENMKDEWNNCLLVKDYYMNIFLQELLPEINAPEGMINNFFRYLNDDVFNERICELISSYGIEKYKKFIDNYNKKIEFKKQANQLLTPEEIVKLYKTEYRKH